MTQSRASLVSLDATPFYHCVSHSFLCGKDKHTSKDFSHRHAWMKEHLETFRKVICVGRVEYTGFHQRSAQITFLKMYRKAAISLRDRSLRLCNHEQKDAGETSLAAPFPL